MTNNETPNTEAAEAVPEPEDTAVSEPANPEAPGDADPTPPRTFTQEEVDKMTAEARSKGERKAKREWEQAQVAEAQRPVPLAPPQADQYDTPEAFWDAVTTYKAAEMVAQQQQQQQLNTTDGERAEAAREKYPDFEMAHKLPAEGGPAITTEMATVIKGSELGPEIVYHLYKNRDESLRIYQLTPLQQAMEIGKIEASLKNTPTPVKKASSAPPQQVAKRAQG